MILLMNTLNMNVMVNRVNNTHVAMINDESIHPFTCSITTTPVDASIGILDGPESKGP